MYRRTLNKLRYKKKALILLLLVAVLFVPVPNFAQKLKPEKNVYITRKGTRYHLDSCQFLRRSKITISLEEAKKYYLPCKVCKPDSMR